MEISALTIKLIILLLPGVIAHKIYRRLTISHKNQTDFMFVIISILLGISCYIVLQLIISILYILAKILSFECLYFDHYVLDTFKNLSSDSTIPYTEVIFASAISIFIGLIITKFDNDKILNKIGRKLKISYKYGDENLFTYYLNSPSIEWVYLRDLENELTYLGSIELYSENNNSKEIVLNQVTVYSYPESDYLYEIDKIYLNIPNNKLIIEKAKLKSEKDG